MHEAVAADGLAARVLAQPEGERLLTDLDHLGQMLHEVAHRDGLGLPGLLAWLRAERRAAATSNERTRRLDTDARAVQIVTIHGSKGLQYPVVYLPLALQLLVPRGADRAALPRRRPSHPRRRRRRRSRAEAARARRTPARSSG